MGNEESLKEGENDHPMHGLIPRSIEYLFQKMIKNSSDQIDYYSNCSFLEIYNEQVIDLLTEKKIPQNLHFRYNEQDVIKMHYKFMRISKLYFFYFYYKSKNKRHLSKI